MGHRLTKIYTRQGDKGDTVLGDTSRVAKNDWRVEVMGDIDELSSAIGIVIATQSVSSKIKECLQQIQHDLFDLGGEISIPNSEYIKEEKIIWLENEIDRWNENLPYLKEFILPGGHMAAAHCHLARAICRRAERHLFTLSQKERINSQSFIYLNRLSDLLFVLARQLNQENQHPEIYWKHVRVDNK